MNVSSNFPDIKFLHKTTNSGTVISAGSTLVGEIAAPASISVSGRVKGDLNASEIVIEKEGIVEGSVISQHLIIIGKFEGNVSSEKITIASSGIVKGDLSYKRLMIDDGAILDVIFHKI